MAPGGAMTQSRTHCARRALLLALVSAAFAERAPFSAEGALTLHKHLAGIPTTHLAARDDASLDGAAVRCSTASGVQLTMRLHSHRLLRGSRVGVTVSVSPSLHPVRAWQRQSWLPVSRSPTAPPLWCARRAEGTGATRRY